MLPLLQKIILVQYPRLELQARCRCRCRLRNGYVESWESWTLLLLRAIPLVVLRPEAWRKMCSWDLQSHSPSGTGCFLTTKLTLQPSLHGAQMHQTWIAATAGLPDTLVCSLPHQHCDVSHKKHCEDGRDQLGRLQLSAVRQQVSTVAYLKCSTICTTSWKFWEQKARAKVWTRGLQQLIS